MLGMKIFFLFFFRKAIKIAGSAQKNRVGRVTPVEEKALKFWYHLYESNLKYQV